MTDFAYFVDRAGALGKLEQTPQGGYRVPAKLARVGVLEYDTAWCRRQKNNIVPKDFRGARVRIYTPPEVLEAAADSAKDAPVTLEHPPKMVSPETYQKVARGHVSSETVEFDGEHLNGYLAVLDGELLADIEVNARREVSMGYLAKTRWAPGKTPSGEEYDAIREAIEYNHAAVVRVGRAGAQVCLALDSEDIPNEEVTVTTKLKIKGAEVALDSVQASIDRLEGELDSVTAERDTLRAERDTLKADLAKATSDETLDAKFAEREAQKAAKAEREKRVEAVKAAFPGIVLDGKSDAYIDGRYEAIEDAKKEDPDGLKALRGESTAAAATEVKDAKDRKAPKKRRVSAYEKMVAAKTKLMTVEDAAEDGE